MKKPQKPLDDYMRHIAHANHIIFNEVLNELDKQNANGSI